ncbi:oligopeptide ABC transporter-like protein [Paenibacillus larvae subsp. larvae B-3650]|nr:oligopeptide ABC transporter-like protein [Paenibacillus larvae subsp. larvae B-3650]
MGLGTQPPEPEWGKMISDSRQFFEQEPWTVIFPGLSIMLTVLGFNLLGDGLRDVLDPRMKN